MRGGKRAGKSVCVSAVFASRVTGMPITLADGTEIKSPWPAPRKDYPRRFWIIGWDTKHIGQTIYRLLFEPGQGGSYRVIQDQETGLWRTWNRANPEDAKRIEESKLSEPLIPDRFLDGPKDDAFAWEDKKEKHFTSVKLNNGSTIYAFPSSARNPKQGDNVSGIWIDEDIQFPGHLKEWQDRLTDEEGWFMWSVWPHMKNEALLDLIGRAEMGELEDDPQIKAFQLVMTDNPFLSKRGKDQSLGRMESSEEIARRNRGELLTDALSMYQFSPTIHQIQRPIPGLKTYFEPSEAHKVLQDIYLQNNSFPRDWTRYLSIDPSNTRTAVLSWVVPPPDYEGTYFGNVAIAEWELIGRRLSASQLATEIKCRVGTLNYEAFIMDQNAGRQTHAGRDESTMMFYGAAFKESGLSSRLTSYSFSPGCNIPTVRYRMVRTLMNPQELSQIPGLLIVEEKCPETKKEFTKYRKKSENRGEGVDSVLDEPANPRLFDCMASVEYFAAYIEPMFHAGQAYISPSKYRSATSPALLKARKIMERQRSQNESGVVVLGAGE